MAVLLGLSFAIAFGTADFLGARAARAASTSTVLLVAQAVSVVGAIMVAAVVGAHVTGKDIGLGLLAGAVNVVGLGLLYHGLAHGRIGVVAPLTAVIASLVPIAWALVRGERPSWVVLVGATFAIVAGAFVSREPDDEDGRRPVGSGAGYAFAAGALFGTSLILFSRTSDDAGLWPVFAARSAGLIVVLIGVAFFSTRTHLRFPTGAPLRFAVGAGALEVIATSMLLLAVHNGLLVVIAPIAALAPAFTVLWAWALLHERMAKTQIIGLVFALVGLALVATG